jgi:hypothetical protein
MNCEKFNSMSSNIGFIVNINFGHAGLWQNLNVKSSYQYITIAQKANVSQGLRQT